VHDWVSQKFRKLCLSQIFEKPNQAQIAMSHMTRRTTSDEIPLREYSKPPTSVTLFHRHTRAMHYNYKKINERGEQLRLLRPGLSKSESVKACRKTNGNISQALVFAEFTYGNKNYSHKTRRDELRRVADAVRITHSDTPLDRFLAADVYLTELLGFIPKGPGG